MNSAPRQTIVAIDLIRVVAALLVVAYHLGGVVPRFPSWQVKAMHAQFYSDAASLTASGWIGVEIFFVISGLVIATSARGSAPADFLRRRWLRLAPAVWICASITALFVLATAPGLPIAPVWAMSVLLLPVAGPIDPSYWSLSVEFVFYVLVATTLLHDGDARTLELAGTIIGTASAAFWLLASAIDLGPAVDNFGFFLTLLPHGCFFGTGVLLAARGRRELKRWEQCLLAAMLAAGAAEILHHAQVAAFVLQAREHPLVPLLIFAAAVAVIDAASRLQPLLTRWVTPFQAARAGAATYPLYLLHQVAGAATAVLLMRWGWPAAAATVAAFAIVLALACGIAWRAEPALRRALDAVLASANRYRAGRQNYGCAAPLPSGVRDDESRSA